MSEYSQLLIPASASYRPSSSQIAQFLGAIIKLRVVPKTPTIELREIVKVRPETVELTNPFTGEVLRFTKPSRKPQARHVLMDIAEIEEMAKDYPEFDVIVSASGRPRLPPLSIDFADDYNVA